MLFTTDLKYQTEKGLNHFQSISSFFLKSFDSQLHQICIRIPHIFLNPSFFSVITSPSSQSLINQAAIGLLPTDILNYRKVELRSNKDGVVYIPYLGYKIEKKNLKFYAEEKYLSSKDWISEVTFDQTMIINSHSDIFQELLFKNKDYTCGYNSKSYELLLSALKIIKSTSINYYGALKSATKCITLFKSNDVNSFASNSFYGAAFLNTNYGNTLSFFIEDVAHQGGHVVFSSLVTDPNILFKVKANYSIGKLLNKEDHRDLKTIFHGFFTYSAILECLTNAIESNSLKVNDLKEAYGRIAFSLHRYKADLNNVIQILDSLSKDGIDWLQKFRIFYEEMCKIHSDKIININMKDQPYNFSLKTFLKYN